MSTEHFYTAKQLAGLPGMPGTERAIQIMANREHWPSRQRAGRGGGKEYAESALPGETRKSLKAQRDQAAVDGAMAEVAPPSPALLDLAFKECDLRNWQRHRRDARAGLCQQVKTLMAEGRSTHEAYGLVMLKALEAGEASLEWRQLALAKDGRGLNKAEGEAQFPSLRSVQRWLEAEDLTPKARKKDTTVPAWAGDFLACYQQPQKPSVEQAYNELCKHWSPNVPDNGDISAIPGGRSQDKPSIHQVRRFLDKLPAIVREKGRMGPRELKNLKPFVRRTFEDLWPNDVWSADGHTFDAEVQNPLTGKPFRPEITSIIDIGTRKIVGFSVSLAESALSTVDALRYAITQHGIPSIFYVDNGSGYSNEMLKDEAVGLLSRFGITVKHSLPYNSQARGVIERLHRSVWVAAAKTLPSYIGADMDREASHLNHKLTRTGDKNGVVHLALSWPQFIALCEDAIEAYNSRSHSGLPKFTDDDNKRRHYSPNEYWRHRAETITEYEAKTVNPDDAELLFKPRIKRTVARGEVQLFNNKYFSPDLALYHGEELQVAYDIHDADFVWIYGPEGEFICKAEWGGNEKAYFPKPVVELAREQRADTQIKLLEGKIDDRLQERNGGGLVLEAIPAQELPGNRGLMEKVVAQLEAAEAIEPAAAVVPPKPKQTFTAMAPAIPEDQHERYLFWRAWHDKAQAGGDIPESLQLFINSFPQSSAYRVWNAFYNSSPNVPDNGDTSAIRGGRN